MVSHSVDAARVLIHDHEDPVRPQRGRLAPEQIHARQAVFHSRESGGHPVILLPTIGLIDAYSDRSEAKRR